MKYAGKIKVTGKRQVTLPAEMCRDLGIEEGDYLQVEKEDGAIRIRPIGRLKTVSLDDPFFALMGKYESTEPGDAGRDHDRWIADEAAGDRQ